MSILDEESQRQVQMRFLDLSGVHISTKEELQNIMFKMLEVRLRPDKLSEDEINRIIYCESSSPSAEYPFLNPIPASMRDVDLAELSQVDIDWRMLTLARPSTKQEMEIFTRFVELEKLKLKSVYQEDEKAESRVTAIKVKVQADGFEQETNSDEFTYDYFSRRHAAEEVSRSEDSSKKTADEVKRKMSQKLDSVTRQETFPEPSDSPSPIPDSEPEEKRKLSAKKRTKKLRKNKTKRRKRRRRIKRLRNGRVVFITIKRRKNWYTSKKKKKKNKKVNGVPAPEEQMQNVIKSSDLESTTVEEQAANESISKETKDSQDVSRTGTVESSAKTRRTVQSKKPTKVSNQNVGEKGVKMKKDNLNNASKTNLGVPKLGTGVRHINIHKHIKGASSRLLTKRGTFTRSTNARLTKSTKVARLKITQTSRARKKSTNAKLDADGKEIEPDEIGKEGRDLEEKVPSAKLSSSASGKKKTKVKNRTPLKTLVRSGKARKRTPKSPSEEPPGGEDSKENTKDALT